MINYKTLTEAFLDQKSQNKGVYHILGENNELFITYAELQQRARGLLHHFQQAGVLAGDELIIAVTSNEQFLDAFWAATLGGIVPVPLAFGISDEHRAKIFRVFSKLKRPNIFISSDNLKRLEHFSEKNSTSVPFEQLRGKAIIIDEIENLSSPGEIHNAKPEDTALIQFSSGSTSEPKGVVLSHENLCTNVSDILSGIHVTKNDSTVSWMPLTHDMGLIGFHICELMMGLNQNLLPTELFVRRPMLWMQVASDKKITVTCSPNFGYKHFLKAFNPEKNTGLDLSSIRVIFNGAEPISQALCHDFTESLAPFGLNGLAMFPVYGLAEASLAVAFPEINTGVRVLSLDKTHLNVGEAVSIQPSSSQHTLEYVIEGRPIKNCQVRITTGDDLPLPENTIGNIEISGKNVTKGYYNADGLNQELIRDGWVNTGDLGFIHRGELVVTGRSKEIIFVNGQNLYPHDLENVALTIDGLELGKVAFAGLRENNAPKDTVIAFLLHKGKLENLVPVAQQMKIEIAKNFALEIDAVVPVGKIPKTTSGKIQRYLLVEEFTNGLFDNAMKELNMLLQGNADEKEASNLEEQLLFIAKEFITDREISTEDNIFEIGTSSLTLAQIHERIEEKFPGKIEITDFFDHPTIKEIASFLNSKDDPQVA